MIVFFGLAFLGDGHLGKKVNIHVLMLMELSVFMLSIAWCKKSSLYNKTKVSVWWNRFRKPL